MRILPLSAAVLPAVLLLAACASLGNALPVPGTAGVPAIPEDAVEAVRTADNGDVIHEYRVGGQLRVVKVVPVRGVTYYLVDSDGDGHLDPRDETPVTWFKLYGW